METAEVQSLIEDLTENIDDLEISLGPLLSTDQATLAAQLPLLDKAKLHVLHTYAIESILFSYLRLNGVDAKEHAVFHELSRVKEYFDKIRRAETSTAPRTTALDKDAAARFIKNSLSGNDSHDGQIEAKKQEQAKRKADAMAATAQWGTGNRFEAAAKRLRASEEVVPVVRASELDDDEDEVAAPVTAETASHGVLTTFDDASADGSVKKRKNRPEKRQDREERHKQKKANGKRSHKERKKAEA